MMPTRITPTSFANLTFGLLCLPLFLTAAEVAPEDCRVTASSHETAAYGDFKPENTLDGVLTNQSSWRAEGHGVWLQFDLQKVLPLEAVRIAFMNGDGRTYTFDILASKDAKKWESVATSLKSSGESMDYERFELTGISARYLRLVGHGNSNKKFPEWFNLNEVRIDKK